ncbi:MAG: alpha/beta hydrolase [Pseudomonadota bacterium]
MPDPAPFFAGIADAPAGTYAVYVGVGGIRLRVALGPPGARGLALIFPGRTEYAEKYGPLMTRLAGAGFGTAVIDWRGQGLSTRPRTPLLGHVDRFAAYQDDIAAMLALDALSSHPGPRCLIAHSMGGCIGLRALSFGLGVQAAVFTAPMWDIALPQRWLRLPARAVARLLNGIGLGLRPAGRLQPYVLHTPFGENDLTSDAAAYQRLIAHLTAHPELGLGSPSLSWIDAAFREMDALRAMARPSLPVLGFLGSAERVVSGQAIETLFARLPRARLVPLTGARHEAWIEAPEIQGLVWRETLAFLSAQGF